MVSILANKLIVIFSSVLILIGIYFHVNAAISQQLFGDEIWTIFISNSYNYLELLKKPIEAVHPNTYYIVTRAMQQIGMDVVGVRIATLLMFGVGIVILLKILKELKYSKEEMLVFVAIWTISGYLLRFSYLIRMYSVGILLVLLSILITLRYVRSSSRKKLCWSMLVDLVGVWFVYGYLLFMVVKFLSLLMNYLTIRASVKDSENDKKHLRNDLLIYVSLLSALAFGVGRYYWINQTSLTANYLRWLPELKLYDLGLGVASSIGFGFYQYFEGVVAARKMEYLIGNGFLVIFSLLLLAGTAWLVKKHKGRMKSELKSINNSLRRFFLIMVVISGWLYLFLFFGSDWLGLKIFHIRQIYSVAILFTIFVGMVVVWLGKKNGWLGLVALLLFATLPLRHGWNNYSGDNQAYSHHYDYPLDQATLISATDIELAYKQCGAMSFSIIKEACEEKEVFLIQTNQELTTWVDTFEGKTFYMTPSLLTRFESESSPALRCGEMWRDYWVCEKAIQGIEDKTAE